MVLNNSFGIPCTSKMPFNRLSVFLAIALPLGIVISCPNTAQQTSRLDICSNVGSYINGSVTSADGCFSVVAENDCMYGMTQWEAAAMSFEQNFGFHLNAYDAYDVNGNFPRFALNITISKNLHKPVWFMYEDFIKPHDAKCFTLIKHNNKSKCEDVLPNYDCLVRDSASSLMTSDSYTTIRILADGEKMQYKFRNLYARNVGDGIIFFYSQTSRTNHLVITFQALAGIDSYKVTLCHKGKTICPKNFKVNLSDASTYFERYTNLVTFQISQVTLEKGNYELVIDCENFSSHTAGASCCNQSRIFEIYIAHQFGTADIATIIALTLLFAFCILGAMVLYLRQKILEPIPKDFRMLLVFDSVSIQHTQYVKATRIFLRKLLGVEVLLDVADMENQEQGSPFQWYIMAIERADCIAVVIPQKADYSECRGSPYHKTFQLCLNMLASHQANTPIDNKTKGSNRYVTLILPDSDPEQIPPFTKFMARFQIPYDYFFLRQHIQSIRNPFRVRLPRGFPLKQKSTNKLFSTIVERLDVTEEHVSLMLCDKGSRNDQSNHDCQSNLLPEELLAIQNRTEELDAIYGNNIQSVRHLAAVIGPNKF
ncbi:uncharacterized protein LOC130689927 [Daphnia carinata]|uniref:uncharacterized protein LOC130689927 n=1 Tax=Daphnia carinata TaxID=120202 RepID=UPI00257EAC83|nr:uncharacterized protein LOC130689927 [Daphnia carinata]